MWQPEGGQTGPVRGEGPGADQKSVSMSQSGEVQTEPA